MDQPFGGLLGDTCETRLLQFLLPMYGIEFEMAELVEETGLTRQSIAKAIRKFSDRDMIQVRKNGRTPLYSINEDSPLVKRLEAFDNSLIESMLGPEEFSKIRSTERETSKKTTLPVADTTGSGIRYTHDHPGKDAPCIASRPGRYPGKKTIVRQ